MSPHMNSSNEQTLPVDGSTSNNEGPLPGDITQLHDQLGISEPLESRVSMRRRLGKLTIPPTPVSPDFLSAQSVCDSVRPPFTALMPVPAPDHSVRRSRNVVVFGESGVGKSSVINMIAGKNVTQISNNAVGCTFRYQSHQVNLDGFHVNLWDTVGLDEGTEGTVPAKQAENSLKAFLRDITRWNGVDLLLYCVRGTRVRQALLRNYNLFYAAVCRKKVPVALVVTGLENYEGDMEDWWTEHEKDLIKHGMRFDAHACVTTIHSDHPAIQGRLEHSRSILRDLVQLNAGAVAWKADEDLLISASLPDVRALIRASEKRAVPLIMFCDAMSERVDPIHLFSTVSEPQTTPTSDQRYKYLHVNAQELLLGDSKLGAATTQRPDLLVFYTDADCELDRSWSILDQFHVHFGGETCPIIVIFGGLETHEAAMKMWKLWSSSHNGKIIANPTYYPYSDGSRELVERANEALVALIEERCLIKFGQKLTKFQRFFRHSKGLFTGRI
ncbi:P-loop containing nucleoside triphosphate hydrolase protein [Chiua virens]|nr:P-loop containing nucleoside triphosphate hydrolase protein [Chiua virens]